MTALEFNYQVSTFQEKLRSFAYSLTNNSDDAMDLYQDTVLKAIKYQDKFINPANMKAWLYTIMRNTFINNYRRQKLSRTMLDSSPNEFLINSVPVSYGTPYSEFDTKEIVGAIDNLEDEYKLPFQRHIEGFKYKEISEEFNLPIGTVKSRIYIARQKLMEVLKDYQ